MEFTNEIFFNKPLTAGNTVIITYCGKLYREHSKDVSIVYGYGDNWDNTESKSMIEKENGFEVTITLRDFNTFNFCFKNNFNIWDNNSGFNYIAPIQSEQIIENSYQQEQSSDSEVSDINETANLENISFETNTDTEEFENIDTVFDTDEHKAIENAFSELLDSLLDNEKNNVSNLSEFEIQTVNDINEENPINFDEIFAQLFKELTSNTSDENVVNIEVTNDEENLSYENIEDEYTHIETTNDIKNNCIIEIKATGFENSIQAKVVDSQDENIEKIENIEESPIVQSETDYDKCEVEELDTLMDSLLTSISNEETEQSDELSSTPIQNIETEQNELNKEQVGLPATIQENEDWVDKIINISYNLTNKFIKACKKIGKLIALKAKQYGIINNGDNNK